MSETTPIMRASARAAKIMNDWSESKKAYARRVMAARRCQCCGEQTELTCGESRFGPETWACSDCWNPVAKKGETHD